MYAPLFVALGRRHVVVVVVAATVVVVEQAISMSYVVCLAEAFERLGR